jgi:hypothetical protein
LASTIRKQQKQTQFARKISIQLKTSKVWLLCNSRCVSMAAERPDC